MALLRPMASRAFERFSIILGLLIFLGLHKDLLDDEISVLRGGHYATLHCLSLRVFPVGSSNIAALATTSKKLETSFFCAPAFCCFLLWHLLSI